ncbi:mitochondrial tRNA-specific 2-thiouridylase 1 [Nasonia vitripennis]|uniref:tRNA-5-taurinomethyluridine 2-sulfurtransferase n=1 Tax=Nasonia vitripennis TaxID=7425 RepID=A0A7M7H920_NASVI|nr:mitochondrial tRNA-specific 2-thiouridylase 1 [Nasonia vitripennis]XP_008206186.1 mitochondrial tRNA-specific 2-thiouridylase 1 [Nasonia vitripennis]XP_008206190.1 mitochondrial tRNA-specific 2-thiouridylase 1 [Nasonia vitripennis]
MFKKVIVGISGGVDSAVAALLLKSKGFKVTGIFMRNWDIVNELGECQAEKDYEDAKWICNRLKIPLHDVNFVKDYWNEVFSYLLENYEVGKTPNPDIQCNKKIKFNKFFHYARTELGADAIATGHYARNSFGSFLEDYKPDTNASLLRAKDSLKDQTFFLSQIPQLSLRRTMFPLGEYLKKDVKKMAKEANLEILANKKESMGICFIGSRQFQDFIVEYVEEKPGYFIDFKTGNIVGKHTGIHQWTLGQGCKIGGLPSPYFVFRKDTDNNNIYVVAGSSHPALFSEFLVASNVHWINEEPLELKNRKVYDCDFRFQHRNILVPCSVFKTTSNKLLIRLYKPKRAITPGQYAVLYAGEQCLGSAEITSSGPPFEFLNRDVNDIDVTDPTQVQALQS